MKTTKLVLLTGLCLLLFNAVRAQVKIGDNELDISDNRLLEIERNGEFFLVKDTSGMTIGRANASSDPMMLKLFGYGQNPTLFAPGTTNGFGHVIGNRRYFLGTNPDGAMLEFPLALELNNSTNRGLLSLNDGNTLFGEVQLDSVFSTNVQLNDSINTLRTLVQNSQDADGDTITGNEIIYDVSLDGTDLVILERSNSEQRLPLDPTFVNENEFYDTIVNVRQELADTAALLRGLNFYLADNRFDDNSRTASGTGVTNLTFDSLSQFNITNTPIINLDANYTGNGDINITALDSINVAAGTTLDLDGDDVDITATNTMDVDATDLDVDASNEATITAQNEATVESNTGDVVLNAGGDVDINAGLTRVQDSVRFEGYGSGAKTGMETFLIGVDASGNILDVSLDSIGGDATLSSPVDLDEDGVEETTVDAAIQAANREIDSTIYNYSDTLTDDRIVFGNNTLQHDLTFQDMGTVGITNTNTLDVDATSVDYDGDNFEADYTNSVEITAGDDVVITSTDSTVINAATRVDIDGADVDITANNTIDADATDVDVDASGTITTTAVGINTVESTSGDVVVNATSGSGVVDVNGTDVDIDASNNAEVTAGATLDMDGADVEVTATNTMDIDATDLDVDASNEATITAQNDATVESSAGDVVLNAGGDVDINAGLTRVQDSVRFEGYGSGAKTGMETFLIGVDASGNILDVSLDSIGGDATLSSPVDLDEDGTEETTVDAAIQAANREIDSTIYNYSDTIIADRTVWMGGNTLYFGGSADSVTINSLGHMAIGTNGGSFTPNSSSSNVKLEVGGDILAVRVHSSSDRRFKKNIKPIESALDKVMKIGGVTYDFRTDEFASRSFPSDNQVGFIAQEVESVLPQVVSTDGLGYKAVDYAKVTALLTEAIKEQQKLIEEQKEIIASQAVALKSQSAKMNSITDTMASMQTILDQLVSDKKVSNTAADE